MPASSLPRSFSVILIPPVIPAQAGIHTPRWTPVFAGATAPHLNHRKGNTTPCRHHPCLAVFPSFQFSRHSKFFRHSGESRNLHAALDSGFRRSDGPTPKPPERKHHPLPASSLPRSFSVIPIFLSFQFFRHFNFPRHSGESRNPHAALDSGFRQSDSPTPPRSMPQNPQAPSPSSPSPVPPLRRPRPWQPARLTPLPFPPAAATPPPGPSQSPIPQSRKIPAQMMTPAPCRPRNPPVIITDIRWERKSGSATAQRKVTVTS